MQHLCGRWGGGCTKDDKLRLGAVCGCMGDWRILRVLLVIRVRGPVDSQALSKLIVQ